MIMFKLPFPPSVNTYWRNFRGRMVLSQKGRDYKNQVIDILSRDIGWDPFLNNEELKILIDLHPPDKRRRDIDNYSKGLLDALESASFYSNDSQIKSQLVRMNKPIKGGYALITIGLLNEIFNITF